MLLKPLVPQNAGLGSHRTWYLGWDVDQAIMVSKRMNDLVWLPTQKLSVENLSSFIFLHMYVCIICTPNGVLWELKLCYCLPYGTPIVPLNILTLPPWGVPCRSPLVHFNYSSVYMHTLYPPHTHTTTTTTTTGVLMGLKSMPSVPTWYP